MCIRDSMDTELMLAVHGEEFSRELKGHIIVNENGLAVGGIPAVEFVYLHSGGKDILLMDTVITGRHNIVPVLNGIENHGKVLHLVRNLLHAFLHLGIQHSIGCVENHLLVGICHEIF